MEKVKRFISLYVPITNCNFRCHYCYITHNRLFGGKTPELKYSANHVKSALSKDRLGGTCLINFCAGGETLLHPKVTNYVKALLEEGHYVMIVTNGSITKAFKKMADWDKELIDRLFFKFSYHYLELTKRKMLDRFFDNVLLMKSVGASFTLEATPSDELIPYVDEMNKIAIEKVGAPCHVTIARDQRIQGELPILTDMPDKDYFHFWGKLKSSLFEYKKSIFGEKRREFCYAGAWSAWVDLRTGDMKQCYSSHYSQNIFKDVTHPIRFFPIGNNCTQQHCYNGHAFLVIGNIPELSTPSYGEIRNKSCNDGSEWLQPKMKSFMETKLNESNKEYSAKRKTLVNFEIRIKRTIKAPMIIAKRLILSGSTLLMKRKSKSHIKAGKR